ncbi:MAG: glycosyltransferase family 2 protein [Methanomicrobiales archaeon]|nr:glycosyltransferase family 2 protein [Methanomicrobiales archaeon]
MEHDNEHLEQQPSLAQPEKLPGVIVVIPAYNEELVIGSIVLKSLRLVEKVIVVDDGSTDYTSDVARLAGSEVIRLPENMGKAHALLAGLNRARALGCTAAVTLDGDGQHKTREIPIVAKPVLDGKADLVIGSRFLGKTNGVPAHRRVGQKTLDLFTTIGSRQACTDSQSGFRALSKKALENLDFTSYGYGIESDMISHFAERGLVIAEVPITVRYEVPKSHKKNFISHGLGVFAGVINLISYKRPLLAFGIPGFVFFVIGLVASFYAFTEYYVTSKFPFTLSMLSVALLILGLLLIIAGLILNALVVIVAKDRMAENGIKK